MSTETPPEAKEQKKRSSGALGALILHHTITVALVIAVLGLSVWSYVTFRKQSFFYTPEQSVSSTQRYLIASQLHRLELAARAYKDIHDANPVSLEALVEEGLLTRTDLSYPSRQVSYSLRNKGENFEIEYTLKARRGAEDDGSAGDGAGDDTEDTEGEANGDDAPAEGASGAE